MTIDDDAYYQENYEKGAEDETDEDDWYENLAGVVEDDDEDMSGDDEDVMEAMAAYQSAKHRLAKAKKAGQRGWNAWRPGLGRRL